MNIFFVRGVQSPPEVLYALDTSVRGRELFIYVDDDNND